MATVQQYLESLSGRQRELLQADLDERVHDAKAAEAAEAADINNDGMEAQVKYLELTVKNLHDILASAASGESD